MIRFALLFALLLTAATAHAKRVALVVAVGAYQAVPRLANPVNDARLVAASLRTAGFTVSEVLDPDRTTLVLKLAAFRQSAVGAEAAVIYFAGHGVEIDGRNLLLPRDVLAGTAEEVKLTAINARDLASGVNPATRMRLVVLDACRDNPFVAAMGSTRSLATSRGLARETIGGVVTLLATQAGEKAADVAGAAGSNSPFARAFADAVKQPGLEVVRLPSRVARLMAQRDGIQQQPDAMGIWIEDDFRLVPGVPAPVVLASVDLQREAWDLCKVAGAAGPCRDYLSQWPAGTYARLAQTKIDSMVTAAPIAPDQGGLAAVRRALAAVTPQLWSTGSSQAKYQAFTANGGTQTGLAALAEAGDPAAMALLASRYRSGSGGQVKDDAQTLRLYRGAAQAGQAYAQQEMGYLHSQGFLGLAKDEREALRFYRLAAEQGNAIAQSNVGLYYKNGRGGVAADPVQAVRWYRASSDQGYANAQYNLGLMYGSGQGVAQNKAEAARLYKLAADQGFAAAQYILGKLYAQGDGVAQNFVEAARFYKLSADKGNAAAQTDLGSLYRNGLGVALDHVEAARLYKLAADQGLAEAQYRLGYEYQNGRGVAQNYAEANRLYKLSADQGYGDAQYFLGQLYENGLGVAKDLDTAIVWYRKAAAQRNPFALAVLKRLGVTP